MAWTNSGYDGESTPALRLEKARAFAKEIRDKIAANVSDGAKSRDSGPLFDLLSVVQSDIERYERMSERRAVQSRARMHT